MKILTEKLKNQPKMLIAAAALFVLLVLLRLWVAALTPVFIENAAQDDSLQIRQAVSILSGDWLGAFDEDTLAKGVSFPLFLAVNCLSGIRYPVLVLFFYMVSAAVLITGLKPVLGEKGPYWGMALFLIIIWSPLTFSLTTFQRVYRNAVSAPAALFAAGSFIHFYLNPYRKRQLFLAFMCGGMLWFFMNLREDSSWLLPFVCAAAVLALVRTVVRKEGKKIILKKALVVLLPFVLLFAGNGALRLVNLKVYGNAVRNNRVSTAFYDTAGLFLQAEYDNGDKVDDRVVWVSREQYHHVISCSPTLKAIEPDLQFGYDSYKPFWVDDEQCDGDFYIWALRLGAKRAGYYESAKKADAFWKQVKSELEEAYEDGRLVKRKGLYLSYTVRGFTWENISELPGLTFRSLHSNLICASDQASMIVLPSNGSLTYVRAGEELTHTMAILPREYIERDPGSKASEYMVKFCGVIRKCCRIFNPGLFFAGKAAFLALLVFGVRNLMKKKKEETVRDALLISAGLFVTALLLQAAVAWFSVFLGNVPTDQWWFYGAQNLPFLYTADVIAIAVLVNKLRCMIGTGKKQSSGA